MIDHYLDRFAKTINENWDQPALTDFYLTEDGTAQDTSRGNHYTYGEMYEEILHVCDIFQSLGLQKGDHIAICGVNSAHWAIAYLAIATYQGVAVTILHSQSPEGIAHQIDYSDAKALFADADLWGELKDLSLPQVEHVISLDNWHILRGKELIIENRNNRSNESEIRKSKIENREARFVHGNPDELAMICFTSGSTSFSKGVMLSYKNISVSVDSNFQYFSQFSREPAVAILPMGHLYGFLAEVLQPLCLGIDIAIMKAQLSTENILNLYNIVKPHYLIIIPFLLNRIIFIASQQTKTLKELEKKTKNLIGGQVRVIGIGGAAILPKDEKLMQDIHLPILTGYGATECGPRVSLSSSIEQVKLSASGVAVPGTQIRIASNGEILVKGENVMLGYYKDPEATARKIDSDGWLHTGDKGHLDEEGYLYVEGRYDRPA